MERQALAIGSIFTFFLAACSTDQPQMSLDPSEVEAEEDDAQSDDAGSPYRITRISGDLYRFQKGGHFNVFLVTSEGIIMTDPVSELDDNATDWLKEQFAQRFGVPVRYVIYSHHHLDHAAGGDAFADTAEFVGHENMLEKFEPKTADEPLTGYFAGLDRDGDNRVDLEEADALASRFEAWDTNQDGYLDGAEMTSMTVNRVRPPDTVYSDRMTIELGGKTVELVSTPPNDTNDMTVVYFPEERVVYGVDTFGVFGGLPTRPFAGAAMTDWIESYKTVEALDFDILAPGHGPMGRKADVTLTRMAWEDLHAAVAAGIEAGSSLEELQRTVRLDDYMHYPGYEEQLPVAIAEAHRTILAHR